MMIAYMKEELETILYSRSSKDIFTLQFILTAIVGLILAVCVYYYRYKYQFWSSRGLKNPFPLPVVGNLLEDIFVGRAEFEVTRVEKYGKLYGVYMGGQPQLVVADADVLKEISVRDFNVFPNHHLIKLPNEIQKNWIFFMQDEHWKKVRSIISPTFTSGKIKRMFKMMNYCVDELVAVFDEKVQQNQPIDCKELYGLYTMDVVSNCLYAIKLMRKQTLDESANEKSSRDAFVHDSKALTSPSLLRILIQVATPEFILKKFDFNITPKSVSTNFANKSKSLIQTRRRSGKKADDFLQLLMDAKFNDKLDVNDMDDMENHHAGLTKKSMLESHDAMTKEIQKNQTSQDFGLTDMEILANAMFLLMVGYETTNSLLSNATYALAFHQDIQEKLRQELESIVDRSDDGGKCSFDYDKLTSAVYLDSVISETLRLMSPVIFLDREAKEDYYIEKYDVTIPKGTVCNLAFYAIHQNPEYWPEPKKYDPSRFFPENRGKIKSGSYTPFGQGPRHCIGMRFSLTEAKSALARLIMEFDFTPAKNTSFPPNTSLSVNLMMYKNLKVIASRRIK